jgi:hypothetical protein
MDRFTDPQTYQCALAQSVQTTDYIMDASKYAYCVQTSQVMQSDTEHIEQPKCYNAARGSKPTTAQKHVEHKN